VALPDREFNAQVPVFAEKTDPSDATGQNFFWMDAFVENRLRADVVLKAT
jgi:hypothetical protein